MRVSDEKLRELWGKSSDPAHAGPASWWHIGQLCRDLHEARTLLKERGSREQELRGALMMLERRAVEEYFAALSTVFSKHEGDFTNSVCRGRVYWAVRELLAEVLGAGMPSSPQDGSEGPAA